jgi:hypothetical protein
VTIGRRGRWLATVAALIVAALIAPPPPSAVAGAGLQVEAHATWMLDAGDPAVHVAVDFTVTNLIPPVEQEDGAIEHRVFGNIQPGLPREATNIRAEADGNALNVVPITSEHPDGGPPQLSALVNLPSQLFYQETQRFTLRFDLPGAPPRSDSRVRVNPAYAAFDARAWGDPGFSSVEIRVGATYEVTTFGADVTEEVIGNYTVLRADDIADAPAWFVHVSARNDGALDTAEADVAELAVTILSWPGDTEWATRVRSLVESGLPLLREAIGLDYGAVEMLDILQARDPSLLGFAGWYLADLDRIELGETIDEHVVLHELTHIWFNTRLFADRWINEGMAEVFGAHAVDGLGFGDASHPPEPPQPGDTGRVALSQWIFPTIAPSQDDGVRARELYGYATSYWVMAAIADEIGIDGLRAVIQAAAIGETSYVAVGFDPEPADDRRTGWQRLLDLLEERAGSTVAESLYRNYVTTTDQRALLDERAGAREAYEALADSGLPVPWAIRRLMDAWAFDEVRDAIAVATEIVTVVGDLEAAAATLGLDLPRQVRTAYTRAATSADLERAGGLADQHRQAVELLLAAQDAADAPRDLITRLGLIGSDVSRHLVAARSAFTGENPALTSQESLLVLEIMDGANDRGRLRAFWAGGAVLILLGMGTTALMVAIRRRRRTV